MGLIALIYGVICYLIFFATFLYLIIFVAGDSLSALVGAPKTINAGAPLATFAPAALQNLALILVFAVSHSVMARAGFKKWWTRIVPKSIERSTYVLVASLTLIAIYALWTPMTAPVWSLSGTGAAIMTALMLAGFLVVLVSTFLINHFDLFGLKHVWTRFKNAEFRHSPFSTPLFYAFVRHPLYLGFTIAFWAAPTMSVGHFLFASAMTIYMLVAIGYEERDLIAHFGEDYRRYMDRVPMLLPFGRRK